jgi:hypothetical protein
MPRAQYELLFKEKRGEIMENTIYWHDRQVGIECAGRISWFPSAPTEAIEEYELHEHGEAKPVTAGSDNVGSVPKAAN